MGTVFKNIWKWVAGFGTFASILGVILIFTRNDTAIIIALSFVCLMLLVIMSYLLYVLHTFIRQSNQKNYSTIASFAEFRSDNGINSTYDTHRLIQSKRTVLSEITYRFKWSGSKHPIISSDCQDVSQPVFSPTKEEWDKVILKLRKPLLYNECTILHIHSDNDDTDGTADGYIALKVEYPITFIQFRAFLSYKPEDYMEVARFEKRRINSETGAEWTLIESIPFDQKYKCYNCSKIKPVPGYSYRLKWNK
jgi:hypothetical protein